MAELDSLLASGNLTEVTRRGEALLAAGKLESRELAEVQQRLCVANLRLGDAPRARSACEAAAEAMPDDPVNHRNLAVCLIAMGRLGRAVGEFQWALELAPDRFVWRLEYASALLQLGAQRDAAREIERAAELCGECLAADSARVRFRLETEDPDAAVESLERLHVATCDPVWRERLFQTLWQAGRYERLAALGDELATAGLSALEWRLVLQADRELGHAERALRWTAAVPSADPLPRELVADGSFWALVSEICLGQGLAAPALAAIDSAIVREPERAAWHQNRAAILLELGRREEAAAALDRARELGRTLPEGR